MEAAQSSRFTGGPSQVEPKEVSDPGAKAVDRVAKGSEHPQDLADATAWFLSDQDSGVVASKTFELNVAATGQHFVRWTVQAIPREVIRRARRMSTPARQRAQGGGADIDEMKANLIIAAEGTIEPDLRDIASQIGSQDVSEVLKRRFAHKPGLIDQIASEVMTVSGYDDDDVRDATVVRD